MVYGNGEFWELVEFAKVLPDWFLLSINSPNAGQRGRSGQAPHLLHDNRSWLIVGAIFGVLKGEPFNTLKMVPTVSLLEIIRKSVYMKKG